jgi:hypothetical protein
MRTKSSLTVTLLRRQGIVPNITRLAIPSHLSDVARPLQMTRHKGPSPKCFRKWKNQGIWILFQGVWILVLIVCVNGIYLNVSMTSILTLS